MIAVLDWVDGFGADTKVSGIFENIEQAVAFVGDLEENAKKDYPSRYEEFSLGEVDFDYYEAQKFFVPKPKKIYKKKKT